MYSGKNLLAVAILLACGTITVSAYDCPKVCTLEFNQICATNGKEYRLFDSPCMMDAFNCDHEFVWTRTNTMAPCVNNAAQISADLDDCVRPCGMDYNPICVFDGLNYRLFDNVCDVHNAECGTNVHFTPALFTACLTKSEPEINCEKPCTFDYNPVCGFNGKQFKTFSNLCMMDNEHCNDHQLWKQTRMEQCTPEIIPVASKVECEKPCTFEYNPVCGFNGKQFKTFSNLCILNNEHCNDNLLWKQTRMEQCPPEIIPVAANNDCIKPCNRMYSPVCGTDGQQFKIFSNQCVMENEHCTDNHEWKVSTFALCDKPQAPKEDCIKICPRILMPVCGTDGQTYKMFDNKCLLEKEIECDGHQWKATTFSLCENPIPLAAAPKKDCQKFCPLIYRPVCGFNGNTYHIFSNDCELNVFNCENDEHFMATLMGECEMSLIKEEPYVCPANYDPQCGFDGINYRVFGNQCMLNGYNRTHKTMQFAYVDLSFCKHLL